LLENVFRGDSTKSTSFTIVFTTLSDHAFRVEMFFMGRSRDDL
jgi:hypothetical protein